MSQFTFDIKIYLEDTDAGGLVYHANYLKYMERARMEWLNSLGIFFSTLQKEGSLLVVRRASLAFHHPAFLNDELTIESSVSVMRHTRLIFKHGIVKNEARSILCCDGEVEIVCMDPDSKKPTPLPAIILEKIQ